MTKNGYYFLTNGNSLVQVNTCSYTRFIAHMHHVFRSYVTGSTGNKRTTAYAGKTGIKSGKATHNTGKYISEEGFKSKQIETKGKNDFVTHIDKGAEKRIVERLSELLPEAGFIAEEGTSKKVGERYNWIIDPIDGTTNFIHGLSPHSISIALRDKEEIVLGVVYEIGLKECLYSWKGAPAYPNGTEINVSTAPTVADSL